MMEYSKLTAHNQLDRVLIDTLDRKQAQGEFRNYISYDHITANFSSNDCLSLASSADFYQRYLDALEQAGPTSPSRPTAIKRCLGSGGSRVMDGNSTLAEQIEIQIASFHRAEAALLFNSGFAANYSLFSTLPQQGDAVVHDERIHASMIEGLRLSRSRLSARLPFAHNSVADFSHVLTGLKSRNQEIREGKKNVIVAVEALYSLDADLAPLRELIDAADHVLPNKNVFFVVDEAHSVGIVGQSGVGLVAELGLEKRVYATLYTFSKALGTSGAAIVGTECLRSFLFNSARPFQFSTFMTFPVLVNIKLVYDFLLTPEIRVRQARVGDLIGRLHTELTAAFGQLERQPGAASQLSSFATLPVVCPPAHIYVIRTPLARNLEAELGTNGVSVNAFHPPAVRPGHDLIRMVVHYDNTTDQITSLVELIVGWLASQLASQASLVSKI